MATKAPRIDEETLRVGRAVEKLRRQVGLTQEQAAAAAEPVMTSQYWGMHETGRVPGIHKPAVQRKLIEALNRASGVKPALTIDDLAEALAAAGGSPADRMTRIARELGGDRNLDPDAVEAIFPTRDGPVVFRYPGHLTPEGFKDLEAYFAVFLRTRADN